MADTTIQNGLELSRNLLSDLGDLADLLGKSLAQAGIDPEGAAAHFELAKRRSVAVTGLLIAVSRVSSLYEGTRSQVSQAADLGEQIANAEIALRGSIGELPWDLTLRRPSGMRLQISADTLKVLLDSMLALALIWFPEGGVLSMHAEQDSKQTWTRMEYSPGPDSPPVMDGMRVSKTSSKSEKGIEPAGMVVMSFLARAAAAEVNFEMVKGTRARLSLGLPGADPIPRAKRGAKVLVVDDDPDSAFMLEQAVSKAGYGTLTAYDGLTALSRARDEQVALILLDVMLPGMDGYEVLRRLRSEPATSDLPIVMVSAKSRPEDIETGLRLGADQYLTKPLRLADVVTCVRDLVGEPSET